MSALLEARGLGVSYGKVEALRGARLKAERGSIVTVIGPNGAGKTTMLHALMGLVPCRGEVLYEGVAAGGLEVEERVALGLALVPERRELFGEMSVDDNLLLGGYSRRGHPLGGDLQAVYQRFPRLLERRRHRADTLSGGERQMLALGRALMGKPKLLLLDEPSLGLAPLVVRDIFRIIAALRANGVSILLIEQNARAALQMADYAYVLELGEVVIEGPAAKVAADTRVAQTYLGLSSSERNARESKP